MINRMPFAIYLHKGQEEGQKLTNKGDDPFCLQNRSRKCEEWC